MPRPVEAVPVELGQLRELIAVDRLSAGEARQAQDVVPLHTIAYSMPWRVRVRRRWRSDRRLRMTCWSSGLAALALLVVLQLPLWRAPAALASGESKLRSIEPSAAVLAPAASRSEPVAAAAVVDALEQAEPEQAPRQHEPLPSMPELSPRRRLQRADLWLRVGSERAAREARSLLESALAELPDSAHGQAALAEACLLLKDPVCARSAVDRARKARPWRAGYRVLSRRIEAAFTSAP